MMDPNIVVVCVTVVLVTLLLSVAVIGAAGSYERAHRPLTFADFLGGHDRTKKGGDDGR